MKDFLSKISAKINTNVFTIVLYFCVGFLLISSLTDLLLGRSLTEVKDRIFERVFVGIVAGLVHRFISMKKNFDDKSNIEEGK